MKPPSLTLSCDDWTFHTLKLFLRGRQTVELIRGIKASLLQPDLYRKELRDPNSGRAFTWGYTVTMHFVSPENARLLSLREISARLDASLQELPWLRLPDLSVSRIDLAADHLVSAPPGHVCGLIAKLNLPPPTMPLAFSCS